MITSHRLILFSTLIPLLLITFSPANAATWSRSYGAPEGLVEGNAVPAVGGGFYVSGFIPYDFIEDTPGATWVAKLGGTGNILWQKTINGYSDFNLKGRIIDATADGGVVVTGGSEDGLFVLKLSDDGSVNWSKTYFEFSPDDEFRGRSIRQTGDGGYIVAGVENAVDNNWGIVIRLDLAGGVVWSKRIYEDSVYSTYLYPISAIETTDGDFVVTGIVNDSRYGYAANFLVRFDSTGIARWDHEYIIDADRAVRLHDVVESSDGELLLVGETDTASSGMEVWVLKVDDSTGAVIWDVTLGGDGTDWAESIVATDGGGCIVAAMTVSAGHGKADGWLFELDSTGALGWQRLYGEESIDRFYSLGMTTDGSLLVAGENLGFDSAGSQAWVQLTDSTGQFDQPCHLVADASLTSSASGAYADVSIINSTDVTTYETTASRTVLDTTFGYSEHCPCTTCRDDSFEWNNDDSCAASRSSVRNGEIQEHNFWENAEDWISFNACTGREYTLQTSSLGASADTVIEVWSPDCTALLASDDNSGDGNASRLTWTSPADGSYHALVKQSDTVPGMERDYELTLSGDTGVCSTWARTIGGVGSDVVEDIVPMPDGSFMAAGTTNSSQSGQGGKDGWLFRLDPSGLTLWEKTIGGSSDDNLNEMVLKADGERLLLGGGTSSFGQELMDAWITEVDSAGTVTWSRTFGDGADEEVLALSSTGADLSRDSGTQLTWHELRFDDSGILRREWTLFYSDADHFMNWNDSWGWYQPPADDRNLWDIETQSLYGGSGTDEGNSGTSTSDGGSLILGTTDSFGAGASDIWLLRFLDRTTGPAWERTFGGTGDDRGVDVLSTRDGAYLIAGTTTSFGAGGTDVWLIAVDQSGDILWQRTYGGSGDETVTSIRQTIDDGFILAGITTSFGSGQEDGWVLRLEPDGGMAPGCPSSGVTEITGVPFSSANEPTSEGLFGPDTTTMPAETPGDSSMTGGAQTEQCFDACDDADGDHYSWCWLDCDDTNSAVFPGAPEICDGVNNDCDHPSWPAVPVVEDDLDFDGVPVCAGDCDDTDGATFPDAPETNDGLDNQCPGDDGYGLTDEISGGNSFSNPGDKDTFCWTAQPGATRYQVTRSTEPAFDLGCDVSEETAPCHTDPEIPGPGEVFYYLVRALEPHTGSWGRDETGAERDFTCSAGETECDNGIDDDADGNADCTDQDCDSIANCEYGAELTCDDTIDNDGDGAVDCWDNDCGCPDGDGDGTPDDYDNCPLTANPGQEDSDGDTVGDPCDNCPATHNPDQANSDGDGYGDVCDSRAIAEVIDGGGGAATGTGYGIGPSSVGQCAIGESAGTGATSKAGFISTADATP